MRHPRLIPVLLLIIITSLATPLQAQIVLKGKITTEKNEPVAFARSFSSNCRIRPATRKA